MKTFVKNIFKTAIFAIITYLLYTEYHPLDSKFQMLRGMLIVMAGGMTITYIVKSIVDL